MEQQTKEPYMAGEYGDLVNDKRYSVLTSRPLDYWRNMEVAQRNTELNSAEMRKLAELTENDFTEVLGFPEKLDIREANDEAVANLCAAVLKEAIRNIKEYELIEQNDFRRITPPWCDGEKYTDNEITKLRERAEAEKEWLRYPHMRAIAMGIEPDALIREARQRAGRLIKEHYSPIRRRIIQSMRRRGETKKGLSKRLGIGEETLEEWFEKPYYDRRKAIEEALKATPSGSGATGERDILREELLKVLKEKNIGYRKLWFEIGGLGKNISTGEALRAKIYSKNAPVDLIKECLEKARGMEAVKKKSSFNPTIKF